jgi:hypothetical protein
MREEDKPNIHPSLNHELCEEKRQKREDMTSAIPVLPS